MTMTMRKKSMLLSSFQRTSLLLVLSLTGFRLTKSLAFHQCTVHVHRHCLSSSRQRLSHPVERRHLQIIRHVTISSARSAAESNSIVTEQQDSNMESSPQPSSEKLCYYKRIDGSWKPRKELKNLKIGERLFATRLPDRDLLEGKTGPKAFLECGIGRRNNKGKWNIVNGMIRLGKRGIKASIVRKKLNKNIPPESLIEVYVSKIRLEEGTLEVCLNREEAFEIGGSFDQRRKISASTLRIGDELDGIVTNVTPYGVFVDVNANRNGLLHISRVAEQRDEYVAKEDGLKALGLGRGSSVNVIVVSNERKRLELDLAPPLSPEVIEESMSNDDEDVESGTSDDISDTPDSDTADESIDLNGNEISDEEAAMWAAYAIDNTDEHDYDDVDEDEEEEYDEDTDIEDALGIGYY